MMMVFGAVAYADFDLGLHQPMIGTPAMRLDIGTYTSKTPVKLAMEVPLKDRINEFSVGGSTPTYLGDMYLYGLANFKEGKNNGEWTGELEFNKISVGAGYPFPIIFLPKGWIMRTEVRASKPEWKNFKKWNYDFFVGVQYSFGSEAPE